MLEVEFCNRPFSVSQKMKYMYGSHAANGPDETPQSFILETSLTAQTSEGERKRRGGRPLESPESIVVRLERKRRLSVVERQELWLAKKNLKTERAQSAIAEESMLERATSAPDLSRSQKSYSVLNKDNNLAAKNTHERRRSAVARKRSISATGPGANQSLSNIANNRTETKRRMRLKKDNIPNNRTESKRRKRLKKEPIGNLFMPKTR